MHGRLSTHAGGIQGLVHSYTFFSCCFSLYEKKREEESEEEMEKEEEEEIKIREEIEEEEVEEKRKEEEGVVETEWDEEDEEERRSSEGDCVDWRLPLKAPVDCQPSPRVSSSNREKVKFTAADVLVGRPSPFTEVIPSVTLRHAPPPVPSLRPTPSLCLHNTHNFSHVFFTVKNSTF